MLPLSSPYKMSSLNQLLIFSSIFITLCEATTFRVQNDCPYTVWAAAVPGGGAQLYHGEEWVFSGTSQGRIWARTNCNFNGSGHGRCESGDCNGVLKCQGNGTPPATLAEYCLNISETDYINISLVDGYNVPMEFKSESAGCVERVECVGDINSICPTELRDPGGCHNPCTVFNNNQFCCFTGRCGPTVYSKMFKEMCPDAYTYSKDNDTKPASCPAGSDYTVVFCPSVSTAADASTFDIRNNCSYTVWAAAVPGGGTQLDSGQSWSIQVNPGTIGGRIWARTGCQFDGSGRGKCQTGDCGGLLQCQASGAPPNTLAEYALNKSQNKDFFDISLVDGFNVPVDFSSTSGGCTGGIRCTADINGQCPAQLKAPGGCNNPCTALKTDQDCCNSGSCGPTDYSKFFKDRCPDACSYPKDNQTKTIPCPSGTKYKVVFCP